MYYYDEILKRYTNTHRKINSLTFIRQIVSLSNGVDLTPRQWSSIETLLFTIKKDLLFYLRSAPVLKNLNDPSSVKKINNIIAKTEVKLDRALKIFDTYLDLITQRQSSVLGQMLGGCDVLAATAIKQKHSALQIIESPVVYLDRGYGASIFKQDMDFYGYKNPVSLIQIPYSMLVCSYMLTSVAHEVGHAVQPQIGLDTIFPKMIFDILKDAQAPSHVKDLFVLWNRELFADLWAFFCCGKAQSGIRDLLALSNDTVFDIRLRDPHPTNYIRVLLSFEWCRQLWGHGKWDEWEAEWTRLYPLNLSKLKYVKTLEELRQYVPVFSRGIMKAVIPNLKVRFVDLFDMDNLSPSNLRRISEDPEKFKYGLKNLNPCHQFAVFRHMYDENMINGRHCNRLVQKWLRKLNEFKTTIFDI